MTMCGMQAPQERLLGQRTLQKGHKVKSEEDRCYYIPLLDSLKHLGKMEVVKEQVSLLMQTRIRTCALYETIFH